MRRIACMAVALAAALAWGCGGHVLPEIHSEADRLTIARRLFAEEDYGNAIELLKTYTESAGGAADVDQAIYMLGQCYLRSRDFPLAANEFERLLRDYPESDSSGSAAFRLGEAYFGQTRRPDFDQEFTVKALDQWQSYLRGYPGHWLNAEAERKVLEARSRLAQKLADTGNLYLKLRFSEPARLYFQRVLDDYADTPVVGEARLGLAITDGRQGKRDQALAALREIETQFAGHALAERASRERRRLERKKK
jgi:outer membrane protein assembly factor BamD